MWEELQQEYEGRIEFILVDRESDDGGEFARRHNVFYQPVFIIYIGDQDKPARQDAGINRERDLRAFVASALEEGS